MTEELEWVRGANGVGKYAPKQGGGSLPSQWTVGPHGDLEIAPDDPTVVTLKLRPAPGATASQVDQLEVYDDDDNLLGYLDAKGNFLIDASVHGAAVSFYMDAAGAGLLLAPGLYQFKLPIGGSFRLLNHSSAPLFSVAEDGTIATAVFGTSRSLSSSASVSDGGLIPFDDLIFGDASLWDSGSNKFVVPAGRAGKYQLTVNVQIQGNASLASAIALGQFSSSGSRQLTTTLRPIDGDAAPTSEWWGNMSLISEFAEGDEVGIALGFTGVASVSVFGTENTSAQFVRLGT